MIVLGQSSDDKGAQLELLATKTLASMGYRNIVRSRIDSGGSEVDVSADHMAEMLGGLQTRKLLCECKARRDPSDLTDWLKFVGKVYIEAVERNEEVFGCFICLSGVNGNVSGSYESYKRRKNNITVIDGDGIIAMVSERYGLCGLQEAAGTIRKFTERPVKSLEVAYYQEELFWVATFEQEAYALLAASGEPLVGEKRAAVSSLVESSTSATALVDLFEEAEAQRSTTALEKLILTKFVARNGVMPLSIRAGEAQDESPVGACSADSLPLHDFNRIMRRLEERGWVVPSGDKRQLTLRIDERGRCLDMVDILRFMLNGEVKAEVVRNFIGCGYYDRHIDRELISEVQRLQGNVSLTEEEADDLIRLLKLSPSALINLLVPVESILSHRAQAGAVANTGDLYRHDVKTLFDTAYSSLADDFRNPSLKEYFYAVRGVRELEVYQHVRVKTGEKVELEGDLSDRMAILRTTPELGGIFVLVSVLESAPQPWEIRSRER
jgi:hypothetical protein